MYSLTFRVSVTTPPRYERNGTAHAAGASILSPACVARGTACGAPGGLPLGSATHFQCCHSNAARAPIANPPNSAQLVPYHSAKLHPGPCNSVGMRPRTDTQTRVTTILSPTHKAAEMHIIRPGLGMRTDFCGLGLDVQLLHTAWTS